MDVDGRERSKIRWCPVISRAGSVGCKMHLIFPGTEPRRRPVAIKRLDPQMLFDPLEAELDSPSGLIELRDCEGGQLEIIGSESDKPPPQGGGSGNGL